MLLGNEYRNNGDKEIAVAGALHVFLLGAKCAKNIAKVRLSQHHTNIFVTIS